MIPSIEARNPTPGDWTVACDSYGKVRHSRKACIYMVVNRGQAGERIVTLAARIPNWDDAFVMSAARDMRDALRDLLPVFDNSSMQTLATVYAEPIARAQSALEKAEHRT